MDECCVGACQNPVVGLLPAGPRDRYPLCEQHARAWRGSWIRKQLLDMTHLGTYEARTFFLLWKRTEAVGEDPLPALRGDLDALLTDLHG